MMGLCRDVLEASGGAVEGASQARRLVEHKLARPRVIRVSGERGNRAKEGADGLRDFRVGAGPEHRLDRSQQRGELIRLAEKRTLAAYGLLRVFVARTPQLRAVSAVEAFHADQVLPRISR